MIERKPIVNIKRVTIFNVAMLLVMFFLATGTTYAAQSSLSFYGSDIPDAYTRHFFQYFRFKPFGYSVTKDGYTEIAYRLPRSSRFRSFVALSVVLDQSGKICRSRISMQRRFVDDKVRGAFARDVAKSYIQAAVPEDELNTVRSIYNEIFFRQAITKVPNVNVSSESTKDSSSPGTVFKLGSGKLKEGDIIIFGEGAELPKLPKKESDLYRCFTGETKTATLDMTDTVLKFSNELVDADNSLVISVQSAKDEDALKKNDVNFRELPMHVPER